MEDFSLVPTCENINYIPACLRKCKKIYPTETGVNNKLDLSNEDMLSVAVRIKKDTTAINDLTKDEKVKVRKCTIISRLMLGHKYDYVI